MSGFSDVGDVDMFGLDEFGEPVGLPGWAGSMIGAGAGTATTLAVRTMAKNDKMLRHAEGLGLAAGVVASGAMMAFKGTRHAGWSSLAAVGVTNGLRYLAELFVVPPAARAGGWAEAVIERTAVIRPEGISGDVDVRTMDGGMGIATIEPTGAIFSSAHGLGAGMPQLLGTTPQNQRQAMATLVGVPGLQGPLAAMASSFGSTLMGGGH
jgi:hypothetical protein